MKVKKNLPGQMEGEIIDQYILRTWKADPALRAEFKNDLTVYEAYCRAEAAGLIRMYKCP